MITKKQLSNALKNAKKYGGEYRVKYKQLQERAALETEKRVIREASKVCKKQMTHLACEEDRLFYEKLAEAEREANRCANEYVKQQRERDEERRVSAKIAKRLAKEEKYQAHLDELSRLHELRQSASITPKEIEEDLKRQGCSPTDYPCVKWAWRVRKLPADRIRAIIKVEPVYARVKIESDATAALAGSHSSVPTSYVLYSIFWRPLVCDCIYRVTIVRWLKEHHIKFEKEGNVYRLQEPCYIGGPCVFIRPDLSHTVGKHSENKLGWAMGELQWENKLQWVEGEFGSKCVIRPIGNEVPPRELYGGWSHSNIPEGERAGEDDKRAHKRLVESFTKYDWKYEKVYPYTDWRDEGRRQAMAALHKYFEKND